MNCWAAIIHDYQAIRRLVGNCPALRGQTRIQLFAVNQRTLSVWYNNYRKSLDISMVSKTQLPVARQMTSMASAPGSSLQPFPYIEKPDLCRNISLSRTTLWRKRKAQEFLAQEQGLPRPQQPARKEYTCTQVYRQPGKTPGWAVSTCSSAEGKTLEEWLHEKRKDP
ncbi:hypothetical protein QQF64_031687 [Cirrhinus molitorella]|uniref:Uncharacterized protein n=1 Tax=Cirrhinus molitorella TaxID=172907 RepID=A0ABR3MXM7_9TELE